jgi:glycosyltransferase involved in cell wall biosynthesis
MSNRPVLRYNGAYLGGVDGTSVWSEALLAAGGFRYTKPRFDPSRHERIAFARKILYEATFQLRPAALRIHPYAACALDRRAALVVLDTVGAAGKTTGWHPRLLHLSIKVADRLATLSRQEQLLLRSKYDREFTVLSPYPRPEFFGPTAQVPVNRGVQATRVAYWGGWHSRKGMASLIAAVRPCAGVHFYSTGQCPPTLINRTDITWLGRLTTLDLVKLIDHCHVCVYPSHYEGFGLPPYEALLRGRPVIVRPLPCYEEFIQAGALSDGAGAVQYISHDHDFGDALDKLSASRASEREVRSVLVTPDLEGARDRLREQTANWIAR